MTCVWEYKEPFFLLNVYTKVLGSRKQVNILKNNTTLLSFKDMFRHP